LSSPLRTRIFAWLWEHRWFLVVTLAALIVRLHWNLVVHPPGDYVYSDMRGYVGRADSIFTHPWGRKEYDAFFPYGTHFLLFVVKALFGRTNDPAIAVVYACMGAALVGFGYLLARRVSSRRWVAPAVGLMGVFYYPHISLGGYFLSEIPFALCLTTATWLVCRLVDDSRKLDAWWLGVVTAVGFTFRPQIILSVGLFAASWLILRKRYPKVTFSLLLRAAVPLVLVIAFSVGRLYWHTERWGLISENGRFNQVFGRCHNKAIVALPDSGGRGRTRFAPPPLIQLEKHSREHSRALVKLNPAIGIELTYRGYIGDKHKLDRFIRKCIKKTGWKGQLEYAAVNAVLLWRYNIMWPDSGKKQWQGIGLLWVSLHSNLFAIPALLGLVTVGFPRRAPKQGILALHLLALLALAVVYFGDTRIRCPYDLILIVLALEVVGFALAWLWPWFLRVARSRNREEHDAVQRSDASHG